MASFLLAFSLEAAASPTQLAPIAMARAVLVAQADVPTANIDIADAMGDRDGHGLVPLNDWVPLFSIMMVWSSEDEPAFRTLTNLQYTIVPDPVEERTYDRLAPIIVSDLLEFAMFQEFGAEAEDIDGVLNDDDRILFTWTNTGENDEPGLDVPPPADFGGSLFYSMQFSAPLLTSSSPNFPNSYIVAVRTSATWINGLTLAYEVPFALAFPFPVDDEGMPQDSYSPDFFADDGPEILAPEVAYSSSFAVYDMTGGPLNEFIPQFFGNWNFRALQQTPTAERARPRFDLPGTPIFSVTNQFLHWRELIPIEDWTPLLGINIHATPLPVPQEHGIWQIGMPAEPQADLQEVNLVFTDIGADPFGAPGNGGFDPRTGLDGFTRGHQEDDVIAIQGDLAFNGVGVFHDTNNDGIFDAPAQQIGGGAAITDRPLRYQGPGRPWEYVPFPPGGGDPWWKIKLLFTGGARRVDFGENAIGFIEPVPDGDNMSGEIEDATTGNLFDFFVAVRPDSGATDISTIVGDGTGIIPGADFKCFVEPRRINAVTGSFDGGIYIDSMIPSNSATNNGVFGGVGIWQNDTRWGLIEPWWPQRTHNETNTKPTRTGFEIHDLVLAYDSNGRFTGSTPDLPIFDVPSSLFLGVGGATTRMDRWMDPFGLQQIQFLNGHSVGVLDWRFRTGFTGFQFPFEVAPFFNFNDSLPGGPRSNVFPNPPPRRTLIDFSTWPATLSPGEYPRLSDWAPVDRATRMLRQHIDTDSPPTAMLGFNLVGVRDIITQSSVALSLVEITVALWGPDFEPSDLMPLDPDGEDEDSGVALWFDTTGLGIVPPSGSGAVIPLDNLRWRDAAEPIDLDGDRVPDDMDGNGVVDSRDYAWVLRIRPKQIMALPSADLRNENANPEEIDSPFVNVADGGDDLFFMVRASDHLSRFEQFRALVPATLPSRPAGAPQEAGLKFVPAQFGTPSALIKSNPDEGGIVQDFLGNDTLITNVPLRILNLANADQRIVPNGPAIAILGLDVSTNMPDGTVMTGTGGIGGPSTLTVTGAGWTPGAFAGRWLVDLGYETFQILNNSDNQLTLLSGIPRDGDWRIVKDPTFLEQLIVEFYNELDPIVDPNGPLPVLGEFNVLLDLLPLHIDQTVSGVAIYRDNDNDPNNRNGVFDVDIDIPLVLDDRPILVGEIGEPLEQVRFVFSSPGTDNLPVPIELQPRNRQWIPDTFGINETDPFHGADFFIVVRASGEMEDEDDFSAGIVSWGPNTPTEPDPDTFSSPLPPELIVGEANKFRDFPWGSRAVGFISIFETPPPRYSMDGNRARVDADVSGFNWIRSHAAKFGKSFRVEADIPRQNPAGVRIDSVSVSVIPIVIAAGDTFTVVIRGENFGTIPTVSLGGYAVTILEVTDAAISVSLQNLEGVVPTEPVVLIVRNRNNNTEQSRSNLFTLTNVSTPQPKIAAVSPGSGGQGAFPVTISGVNFHSIPALEVHIGGVRMPIRSAAVTGDRIVVSFPLGGFPDTGPLDVTVINLSGLGDILAQDTMVGGFVFINPPAGVGPCFIATAAYGSPAESHLATLRTFRDESLLTTAFGAMLVDTYYTASPPVADYVAVHPWLAALVRGILTPLTLVIQWPALLLMPVFVAGAGFILRFRYKRYAS